MVACLCSVDLYWILEVILVKKICMRHAALTRKMQSHATMSQGKHKGGINYKYLDFQLQTSFVPISI